MARAAGDEVLGRIGRQYWEIFRQVRDGSLPAEKVFRAFKQLLGNRIVTVDASRSWEEAVKACGCDNVYINSDFDPTKHLPLLGFTGQRETEIILRKQDETTTTKKWLSLLDDNENSKDKFTHPLALLALGENDPDEQREAPIFMVWRDSTGQLWYLDLDVHDGERDLRVDRDSLDGHWNGHDRAAVSAKSA